MSGTGGREPHVGPKRRDTGFDRLYWMYSQRWPGFYFAQQSPKAGELVVIENAEAKEPKTGALAKQIGSLGWKRALVIDGAAVNENFAKAARNIETLDVLPSMGANVYDILKRDTLVLTKAGVEALEARLK